MALPPRQRPPRDAPRPVTPTEKRQVNWDNLSDAKKIELLSSDLTEVHNQIAHLNNQVAHLNRLLQAVTRNPTAEWLARQITEAFPCETAPKYLIRWG